MHLTSEWGSDKSPLPKAISLLARSALVEICTNVDGLNIFSRAGGDGLGTPFVLLHGLVISSIYMVPLGEYLVSAGERVFALDLPGFGKSEAAARSLIIPEQAEFLIRWLSAMKIDRCHLVANSLGCQISAHVAVMAPNAVQTLMLIGATIDPSAHSLPVQAGRLIRDAIHEPPSLWFHWLGDFRRAGLTRSLAETRNMFHDHIETQLPRIQCPTLVLHGENDPTMPASWAQRAASLVPESEVVVIPGAGHCVHYTKPAEVAKVVLRFIEAHPTAISPTAKDAPATTGP